MSKSGKYWQDMIKDINEFGKIEIKTLVDEKEYLVFSLAKQPFQPSDEWINLR